MSPQVAQDLVQPNSLGIILMELLQTMQVQTIGQTRQVFQMETIHSGHGTMIQ